MDVTFLLGSGVSLPSGLDSVERITERLFEEPYFEHSDQSMIKGQHPSEYLREHYDLSPLQDFLLMLREKYDHYFENKFDYGHTSSYEDLYYLVDQMRDERKGKNDNLAIRPFIEEIEKSSFEMRNRYKSDPEKPVISLENFCDKCKVLIETVIKYGLWDTEVEEMGSLVELTNRDEINLKLFTLNHDTLLEKLFTDNEIDYIDGFSESDGNVRWYQPDIYDDEGNHIYHLHGARNWSWVRTNEFDEYAIMLSDEKWYGERENGEEVRLLMDKGHILLGANKSFQYDFGIFGELQFRLAKHLRSCKRIVVSGYGWNDFTMNMKLLEWVRNYDDAKLMLVHNGPQQMVKDSRYLPYNFLERYSDHLEIKEHWFGELTADDVITFSTY